MYHSHAMSKDTSMKVVYALEPELKVALGEFRRCKALYEKGQAYVEDLNSMLESLPQLCKRGTDVDSRHTLYREVLGAFLEESLEIAVTLEKIAQDGGLTGSSLNAYDCDFVDPRLLEAESLRQPYSPLDILRLTHPHLSDEITKFFYNACAFVIGSEKAPEDGFSIGNRWLESIPPSIRSNIKQVRVFTTYETLMHSLSSLSRMFRTLTFCRPINSSIGLEFEVMSTKIPKKLARKRHDAGLHSIWVNIRSPHGADICLDIFHDAMTMREQILDYLRCCLKSLVLQMIGETSWHPCETNDELSTEESPVYIKAHLGDSGSQSPGFSARCPIQQEEALNRPSSQDIKRVNFLQVLPRELRDIIYNSLIDLIFVLSDEESNVKKRIYQTPTPLHSNPHRWSHYFHCSYEWRVNKQFVEELALAFYSTHKFNFNILPSGCYLDADNWGEIRLTNFLSLAGPELISHIANLQILWRVEDDIDPLDYVANWEYREKWPSKLRWLAEALNHFSARKGPAMGVKKVVVQDSTINCVDGDYFFNRVRIIVSARVQVQLANEKIRVSHF